MKPINQYFTEEMRSLHHEAQAFAQDYPEQAAMLNLQELRDKDPYVERLLEGVAFLTGQVRQQIDQSQVQISQTLLEQLCPQLLRPIPAATIVEFQPKISSQQKVISIPQGTELFCDDIIGQPRFGFSTSQMLTVYPIHIKQVESLAQSLQLTIQTLPHTDFKKLGITEIPLYLHADPMLALSLFMHLTQHVSSVKLNLNKQGLSYSLDAQNSIVPLSRDEDSPLVPSSGRSWVGLSLLQSYFAFREKFLFVKLTGIDTRDWPDDVQDIKVQIEFENSLNLSANLTLDNFKLHAVPAVNLINTHSEPINHTNTKLDYALIADYAQPSTMVYDVTSISASDPEQGVDFEIQPFHVLSHSFNNLPSYQIVQHNYQPERSNLKLNFSNLMAYPQLLLACEILAFHGDQPRQYLQVSALNQVQGDFSTLISGRNLLRPSTMLLPPTHSQYQQQLLGLLRQSFSQIDDREKLCNLLQQFDWTNRRENQQRINGIKNLVITPVEKFINGSLVSGWQWAIDLHKENYASIADAYLFGYILHLFLLTYNNINEVLETKIQLQPQGQVWLWQE